MNSRARIRRFPIGALIVAAGALAACYPSPDMSVEEYDTVVTVVADGADFSGFATYFLPDSVYHRPEGENVSRAFDDLILGDIHRNMQQLGYRYEPDPTSNPTDLLVVASAITQEEWVAYAGWPFSGKSIGGSFVYPAGGFRYLYTLGTVSIDIAQMKDFDPDSQEYPVAWTAAVSGPLQRTGSSTATRITDGIDRAFAQSPYLKPD